MIIKTLIAAHASRPNLKERKGHVTIGVLLTVTGLFLLIKQSGWIPPELNWSNAMWPLLLIAAGLFILLSSRIRNSGGSRD